MNGHNPTTTSPTHALEAESRLRAYSPDVYSLRGRLRGPPTGRNRSLIIRKGRSHLCRGDCYWLVPSRNIAATENRSPPAHFELTPGAPPQTVFSRNGLRSRPPRRYGCVSFTEDAYKFRVWIIRLEGDDLEPQQERLRLCWPQISQRLAGAQKTDPPGANRGDHLRCVSYKRARYSKGHYNAFRTVFATRKSHKTHAYSHNWSPLPNGRNRHQAGNRDCPREFHHHRRPSASGELCI